MMLVFSFDQRGIRSIVRWRQEDPRKGLGAHTFTYVPSKPISSALLCPPRCSAPPLYYSSLCKVLICGIEGLRCYRSKASCS